MEQLENKSKVYYNGSAWKTNNCGEITVVGKVRIGIYYCKFLDGTIVEARHKEIKNGKINNPNERLLFKVGYLGVGSHKTRDNNKKTKEYIVWSGMLERCYSEKCLYSKTSYKDVTVDSRWHNFQNFCEDLPYVDGYENWKNNIIPRMYHLDKDIKCSELVLENSVYSLNTCKFITGSENTKERNRNKKLIIATNSCDNSSHKILNIKDFTDLFGLNYAKVLYTIRKKEIKIYENWTFNIDN